MPTTDAELDTLLRALADATRRGLLDRLRDQPGQTLTELLQGAAISRQALSKHLAVLEDAELVVPVWRGREKLHYLNPAPLQALPARWVAVSAREAGAALQALRDGLPPGPDQMPHPVAARAPQAAGPAQADDLAALLLAPPSPLLQGQPVMNGAALQAAQAYLAQTASAVQRLLTQLGADQGYHKPSDGGFSLAEHVQHLLDIETLGWRERFERILREPQPTLPGVDGDRLAAEKNYSARPWRGAARQFVAARRHTLAALARFDADTLRLPVRFGGQRARAGGVLAAAVAHDLDHRPLMAERWMAERGPRPKGRR